LVKNAREQERAGANGRSFASKAFGTQDDMTRKGYRAFEAKDIGTRFGDNYFLNKKPQASFTPCGG
jgi:hypothetical protein